MSSPTATPSGGSSPIGVPTMSIFERLTADPSSLSSAFIMSSRRRASLRLPNHNQLSSSDRTGSDAPSPLVRRLSSSLNSLSLAVAAAIALIALFGSFSSVDAAASSNHRALASAHLTGGCKAVSKCCRGKDASCFTMGPRMSSARRTPDRKCYCDETCRLTRDCCADYQDYCTRRDCVVSDWGNWGACSHECGVGVSERERKIVSDATNGGQSCPPLKQKRVCIGTTCIAQRSILSKTYKETAKVLPAAFGSWRRHKLYDARQDIRRNLYANEMDKPEALAEQKRGYCGRYRVVSVSHGCQIIPWVMSMMPVGGEVCAECQPEAMKTSLGNVCKGHGEVDKATRFTTPIKNYCYGTWQLLGEMTDTCSCSLNSTLIFV